MEALAYVLDIWYSQHFKKNFTFVIYSCNGVS